MPAEPPATGGTDSSPSLCARLCTSSSTSVWLFDSATKANTRRDCSDSGHNGSSAATLAALALVANEVRAEALPAATVATLGADAAESTHAADAGPEPALWTS